MNWLGWWTKSRIDVSLLDEFILLGELLVAGILLVLFLSTWRWVGQKVWRWKLRKKQA